MKLNDHEEPIETREFSTKRGVTPRVKELSKSCLAYSPPKTKVRAKAPQESQRVSSRAKKIVIKYGNNVGYQ